MMMSVREQQTRQFLLGLINFVWEFEGALDKIHVFERVSTSYYILDN